MSSGCRPVSEVSVAGVTIYTKRLCVYCVAARRLLSSLGLAYEEISLNGKTELRRELSAANGGWPTVPMIFVGETFIGGYDDLRRLHREERLQGLLDAAGVSVQG